MNYRNFNQIQFTLLIVSLFLGVELPITALSRGTRTGTKLFETLGSQTRVNQIPALATQRTWQNSIGAAPKTSSRAYSVAVRPSRTSIGTGQIGAQASTVMSKKMPFARAFSSQRYDQDQPLRQIALADFEKKIAHNNNWINWLTGNIDRDLTYYDLSTLYPKQGLTLDLTRFDLTGSRMPMGWYQLQDFGVADSRYKMTKKQQRQMIEVAGEEHRKDYFRIPQSASEWSRLFEEAAKYRQGPVGGDGVDTELPQISKEKEEAFKLFGLNLDATKEQIKEKFYQLAQKWHPDVNPNKPKAKEKFQEISNAYELLFPKPK